MPELDVNLPSTRQLQGSIKAKISVEIKLSTNEIFVGKIAWQDADYLSFSAANEQKFLISRHAIVYIKPL